jgi:hypothetical protein
MRLGHLCAAALVPFALAAIAGSGCESETIVLATIPDDAAGPPPAPVPCVDSDGCSLGYYCSKATCDAPAGTCVHAPVDCDGAPAGPPVCDCNNITYFNSCVAQVNGVLSYTEGECLTNPVLCGPGHPSCPGNATCALLNDLPHDNCQAPGRCWVIPAQCPTVPSSDRWDSCSPLGAVCVDTCNAITMGGAYQRSQMCPP